MSVKSTILKCDFHLSEIKNFWCQEREIEPIDEIVRLLPWGLQTTLSVLIGDQKDNVQFIPTGEREEGALRGLFNKSIRAYSLA